MQKVLLKKFNFDNKEIVFNEGENYIIGSNSSGKTTIFRLIQYCLGLKKSEPKILPVFSNYDLSLDVSFGNKLTHISRQIGSDNIIFEGDIRAKLKASSIPLGDIYNELLQPNIDKDEDRMVAMEILNLSFLEENTPLLVKDTNIVKKVLGINVMLPAHIKKEIEKFKEEMELENAAKRTLQNYIKRVEIDLRRENGKIKDIEFIIKILDKQFLEICDEVLPKNRLLEDAVESLHKVNFHNEELFLVRSRIIQTLFYQLTSELDITHNVNICNIFDRKELMHYSGGQVILLKLVALIILCQFDEYDWHNGCGLLINDACFSEINRHIEERYRKMVSDECKSKKLQYIEFRYNKKNIPEDAIVLEINGKGGLYGKEIFA